MENLNNTPDPLTAGGADARRPHIIPRPKGQGTSEPIKVSTTTRRRHPTSTATAPRHYSSHDTGSGKRPDYERTHTRRFPKLAA